MKKKHILTGLLMVTLSALAFTACGKKKDTTTKTGSKTVVTTKSKTNVTTKEKTTTKEEKLSSKICYFNEDNGTIAKIDVTDNYLSNAILESGNGNAIMIKPEIENGKFKSILAVTASDSDSKNTPVLNATKIVKGNQFSPISYFYNDLIGFEQVCSISIKVLDESIEIKELNYTFSISIDGLIDESFVDASTISKFKNMTVSYADEKLTLSDDEVFFNITLKSDKYIFETDNYLSMIELIDGKYVISKAHNDGTGFVKYNEMVYELNNDNTIKKYTVLRNLNTLLTVDVTYSSDKKIATMIGTNEPYDGTSSLYPLASSITKSKLVYYYDDYNRVIKVESSPMFGDTYQLMQVSEYKYDSNGSTTEIISTYVPTNKKEKMTYEYTNNRLTKYIESAYNSSQEKYFNTNELDFTYDDDINKQSTKKYAFDGETKTLVGDFYVILDDDDYTIERQYLYYDDSGKLESESYKTVCEYDDEDKDKCTETKYKPNTARTDLYKAIVTAYSYETKVDPDTSIEYEIYTNLITNFYESGDIVDKIKRVYIYSTDEYGCIEEEYHYSDAKGEYLLDSQYCFDNDDNYNLLYSIKYTYNDSDEKESMTEEYYVVVDGDSELSETSSFVVLEDGKTKKSHTYYYDVDDPDLEEIIPYDEVIKSEEYIYNSDNDLLYKEIVKYDYNTRKVIYNDVLDYHETNYREDIITYIIDAIGYESLIDTKEVIIYEDIFNEKEKTKYDYSYDFENEYYTREVYEYNYSYLVKDYELVKEEIYTGDDITSIETGTFYTLVSYDYFTYDAETRFLHKITEYKYNSKYSIEETLTTTYDVDGNVEEIAKIVNKYDDDDITKIGEEEYKSYTTENDLKMIYKSNIIDGTEYPIFRAQIDENNTYHETLYEGIIDEEGKYEKVLQINFGDNSIIKEAYLYINNYEDNEKTCYTAKDEFQGIEYSELVLDNLLNLDNYEASSAQASSGVKKIF